MRPKDIVRSLAAALVLAVLSLAPSAASAHAGHQPPQAAAAQAKQADAQANTGCGTAVTQAPTTAEATAARAFPAGLSGSSCCDGLGCCASGPCTGCCHGAVLVFSSVPSPSLHSVMLAGGDAPSPTSAHAGRLRRPPKSIA